VAEALHVPADRVEVTALNKGGRALLARILREGVVIHSSDERRRKAWEHAT